MSASFESQANLTPGGSPAATVASLQVGLKGSKSLSRIAKAGRAGTTAGLAAATEKITDDYATDPATHSTFANKQDWYSVNN